MRGGFRFINGCYGRKAKRTCRPRRELLLDRNIYKVDPNAPKESSPIFCENCGEPFVKPSTVPFGRPLPSEFFENVSGDLASLDLLIYAGISLVVLPANQFVFSVPDDTVRVVVDVNPVGSKLGVDYSPNPKRDFLAQGPCDQVFLDLITVLGWLDDLKAKRDLLPEASVKLIETVSWNNFPSAFAKMPAFVLPSIAL